ncbi:MAG TPA: FAD-dependent oxidoreductase [Candidatus Paceibacterota bacterium]|jgi:ferredoxin-NADP reductase|nr:FAD-dependent oxidoreductase [Candidatus Paceibacterota bacterium]
MIEDDKKKYTVVSSRIEVPGVVRLELSCEVGAPLYIPGQFITVYLPELGTPEGKAYSISSTQDEPLRITVEKRGEFSRHLCALKPGDTFLATEPEGYFYSESDTSMLVMLAAGIGVAPFRSMILESLKKNPARRIVLLYSSRTMKTIVFKKELDELAAKHKTFEVHHFITREENISAGMTKGRMSAEAILQAVGDAPEQEFFICGSISFVRDMWKGLKLAGVQEDNLYTEAFFAQ